jgi:hypothetical protein
MAMMWHGDGYVTAGFANYSRRFGETPRRRMPRRMRKREICAALAAP